MDKQQTLEHNYFMLREWGVNLTDLVALVYDNQNKYVNNLTDERITHSLRKVLSRTRVRHAIDVADILDLSSESDERDEWGDYDVTYLWEEKTLEEVQEDAGLFGLDETIALSICTSELSRTNFGYIDKTKPGVIAKLNDKKYNTFKDDIVCAIVAETSDQIANRADY